MARGATPRILEHVLLALLGQALAGTVASIAREGLGVKTLTAAQPPHAATAEGTGTASADR